MSKRSLQKYVTTYEEEIRIKSLMSEGYSLKLAVEITLPWVQNYSTWGIDMDRFPQIISIFYRE